MKWIFLAVLMFVSGLGRAVQLPSSITESTRTRFRGEQCARCLSAFQNSGTSQIAPPGPAPGAGAFYDTSPVVSQSDAVQQQQGAATPAPLTGPEVQSLVQKIYMAAFRASDLLTLLEPEKWKLDDAERKSFSQTVESLRQQIKDLEQARSQFAAEPQNSDLGDKLTAAMDAVHSSLNVISRAVAQYDNPARGADYTQAATELYGLQRKLKSYLAFLHSSAAQPATAATAAVTAPGTAQPSKPGPASAEPETEHVEAPSAAPPPATTVETPESVRVYQAKVLLHKLYVATFRLTDLLGVVHPDRWKTPQPLRDAFAQKIIVLRKDLSLLDDRRIQFDDRPQDAYLGFQMYTAITPVISDIEAVTHEVAQFEGASTGSDFSQPAQWLVETQRDLRPYVEFILQNREQAIHGYQADLAACQNTLNYALRPRAAVPIPNFMPILKGVRHPRPDIKPSEDPDKSKKGRGRRHA